MLTILKSILNRKTTLFIFFYLQYCLPILMWGAPQPKEGLPKKKKKEKSSLRLLGKMRVLEH